MAISRDRFIAVGTLGFAGVALVQLSSASGIDRPLLVTSFALAIAVPTLTLILILIERDPERRLRPARFSTWVFGIGLVSTCVAAGGLFWHLHSLAGLLFGLLSVAAFISYLRCQ